MCQMCGLDSSLQFLHTTTIEAFDEDIKLQYYLCKYIENEDKLYAKQGCITKV